MNTMIDQEAERDMRLHDMLADLDWLLANTRNAFLAAAAGRLKTLLTEELEKESQ